MGPCISGCRSDHWRTGSPAAIRNGRPRGPPASGESGRAPAPGWRPSRSISASMRPSRVPPVARPGPDSIPPDGAEGTQSEPGYGSLGGGGVARPCRGRLLRVVCGQPPPGHKSAQSKPPSLQGGAFSWRRRCSAILPAARAVSSPLDCCPAVRSDPQPSREALTRAAAARPASITARRSAAAAMGEETTASVLPDADAPILQLVCQEWTAKDPSSGIRPRTPAATPAAAASPGRRSSRTAPATARPTAAAHPLSSGSAGQHLYADGPNHVVHNIIECG